MAGLLTAGISTAATAKTTTSGTKPAKVKPAPKPKPVTTKVSCQLTLVLQPTAKVTTIVPGTGSGSQSGTAKCPGPVGGGVQTDTFTTDDAGDVTAPYTQWFKGGTLAGQYTLIPTGGGQPSAGNNSFGSPELLRHADRHRRHRWLEGCHRQGEADLLDPRRRPPQLHRGADGDDAPAVTRSTK